MATGTTSSETIQSEADRIRQTLREAGVFAVTLIGGPGCGKSTLIQRVLEGVDPKLRAAVIAGSPDDLSVPQREARSSRHVLHVNGGSATWLDAATVSKALGRLDLASLDLLFIENVGTLTVPAEHRDLGQDLAVTVFSVAAGDDKARKHADLVETADAVILNKIDLTLAVPFDLAAFRADVQQINPHAELFEISALTGRGVDRWLDWLTRRMRKPRTRDDVSHWFG